MNVKLPAGTIGVRGTIVGVQVDGTTGRSLVWLAGPGAGNSAGVAVGSIAVENAGVARDVQRSGWGVEIPDFGSPPSPPFPVPDSMYGTLGFEIAPEGGAVKGSDDADGTSSEPAPASTTEGSDAGALDPLALLPPAETSFSEAVALGSDPLDPVSNPIPTGSFTRTTIGDLLALTASFDGHLLYIVQDVPLQSGNGDLDLFVDLDLVNDVVGVQVVNLSSSALFTSGMGGGATSVDFTRSTGEASFVAQFPYFDSVSVSSPCANGCPVKVDLGFQNIPTQVAGQLEAQVGIGPVGTIQEITPLVSVPISSSSTGQ
jgi:hypothetical protein